MAKAKEKKPGYIERGSHTIEDISAFVGVLALTGTFLGTPLLGTAVKAGLIWAGANYTRNSSKQRRQNVH